MNLRSCFLTPLVALALPFAASAATINIGFLPSAINPPATSNLDGAIWNRLTQNAVVSPRSLVDSTGAATGVSVTSNTTLQYTYVAQNFSGLPESISSDFVFGQDGAAANPSFTFTGLDSNYTYTFSVYALRHNQTDIRSGLYTAAGADTKSGTLNASNNTGTVLVLSNVTPAANGTITFSVLKDVTNNSAVSGQVGYFQLNGLKIEAIPITATTINVGFLPSSINPPPTSNLDGVVWNRLTQNAVTTPRSLVNSAGAATGVSVTSTTNLQYSYVAQNFTGLPESISSDFVFGQDGAAANPSFTFSGLNSNQSYNFSVYALRHNQTDIRSGLYTATGANTKTGVLNASNNTSTVLVLSNVTPAANGSITFSMMKDVTNNSAGTNAGYFQLNGLRIEATSGGSSGGGVQPSSSFIDQNLTELITTNPGFENGTTDWSSQHTSVQSGYAASGVNAAYQDSANFYRLYPIRTFTAVPGAYYRLKAKIATANMAIGPTLDVRFFDASGTQLTSAGVTNLTLAGTRPFHEYATDYIIAPANAATAKIHIATSANAGGTVYYDDVSLVKVNNLPVRVVPTYNSLSVHVAKVGAGSGMQAHIFYRPQGTSTWHESFLPIYDAVAGEYRVSIVDLQPDTTYEVQALLETGGVVSSEGGVRATTWPSSPPIASTVSIASLYSGSGELKIENMHGSPTGWIKITGTGANDVAGGYNTTAGADNGSALLIKNCSYLIFENVHVTGGRYNGIEIRHSDAIRLLRCEISGWARTGNVFSAGRSYESQADVTANRPIDLDAAIKLNHTTRVTVERCYAHDPRSGSNTWTYGHPNGPTAVYVMNNLETGNSVIRYNDFIGNDTVRWNDSIEGYNNDADSGSLHRDSDIHGNMLCFGNDDGIELEGGQKNVRFWGNRIESFYQGISLAPNKLGPSYLYRNVIFNMGDQNDGSWAAVKAGGGTTYSKGKSFLFHNTFYLNGNGLYGVGYGSDSNRAMFMALTRNNIFYSSNDHVNYRNAISDTSPNAWSNFDYDNLASATLSSAQVTYAAGQETHGILNNYPTFVDLAGGDFRLATGSSALNAGQPLANFAENWLGANPDQGAFESGDSSLIPKRPIAISANKYLVNLTATANGGSTTSVVVTLTTGNLGGATAYTVRKNTTNTAWLAITPTSGTLNNNSSQAFTFSVNTAGLSAGQREATVLVRLANGYSVPITIVAAVN